MYCVTFFNFVAGQLQKAYFTRYDDVINFLISRSNIIDMVDHFCKISFNVGGNEE